MEMMQKGEMDPAVAMQLLGQTELVDEKKRSRDASEDNAESGEAGPTDPGESSLDELLNQAKKAKMDLYLNWFLFFFR